MSRLILSMALASSISSSNTRTDLKEQLLVIGVRMLPSLVSSSVGDDNCTKGEAIDTNTRAASAS